MRFLALLLFGLVFSCSSSEKKDSRISDTDLRIHFSEKVKQLSGGSFEVSEFSFVLIDTLRRWELVEDYAKMLSFEREKIINQMREEVESMDNSANMISLSDGISPKINAVEKSNMQVSLAKVIDLKAADSLANIDHQALISQLNRPDTSLAVGLKYVCAYTLKGKDLSTYKDTTFILSDFQHNIVGDAEYEKWLNALINQASQIRYKRNY